MNYKNSMKWMSKLVIPEWGIIQHSKLKIPAQEEPSSIDDNARATILFAEFLDVYEDIPALETTFNFLEEAFLSRKDEYPNNYKNRWSIFRRNGKVSPKHELKDCYGRALCTYAKLSSNKNIPRKIRGKSNKLFLKHAAKNVKEIKNLNALSLIAIAKAEYLKRKKKKRILKSLIEINNEILKRYEKHSDKNWIGPSKIYTYDAYRSAEALLAMGDILNDKNSIEIGLKAIKFLNSKLIKQGIYCPIGNGFNLPKEKKWFQKGKCPAKYSQQGIEAAGLTEANIRAYKITSDKYFLKCAKKGYNWFRGKNTDKICLILPTGEVQDGIHKKGKVNENCGSESVIAYLTTISKLREFE